MKKVLLFAMLITLVVISCKKGDEPTPTHAPSAPFVWSHQYYCASFINTSGDTLCKKSVTTAQFDSMNYNYGAHIYCTYPNNAGITVVGKQINDPGECH